MSATLVACSKSGISIFSLYSRWSFSIASLSSTSRLEGGRPGLRSLSTSASSSSRLERNDSSINEWREGRSGRHSQSSGSSSSSAEMRSTGGGSRGVQGDQAQNAERRMRNRRQGYQSSNTTLRRQSNRHRSSDATRRTPSNATCGKTSLQAIAHHHSHLVWTDLSRTFLASAIRASRRATRSSCAARRDRGCVGAFLRLMFLAVSCAGWVSEKVAEWQRIEPMQSRGNEGNDDGKRVSNWISLVWQGSFPQHLSPFCLPFWRDCGAGGR